MKIDARTRRPRGAGGPEGCLGLISSRAIRLVYNVARAVSVPIIGCGGITTGEDAVEFLMAGASAVQVGTATFRNPRAALDVLEGVEAFMRDEGVEDIRNLIGAAQPEGSMTPATG